MKRFTDAVKAEINSREFKMPMDMPNINMPLSINLGISESLSDAKAKLSSVITGKQDTNKKQEQAKSMSLIISLLDDVRLQCPQSHAGLVIVCTAATLSPLYSDGIRFTWFRMQQNNDQFIKVDESFNGWYSPSIDDIGSKICVQIQDKYGEGLSRYLETGIIECDPLLCSLVEPSIEAGFFRALNNTVSMGIEEDTAMTEYLPPGNLTEIKMRKSNLSTKVAYVELKGKCYIEVNSDGIFIGLNNFDNTEQDFQNKNRIGLHIISSEHIRIDCCQPLSIILTIKVNRESGTISSSNTTTDDNKSVENIDNNITKKIPLTCPWSYIRTSVDDSELPDDGGELEASIFASTLVLLEQFMETIPETIDEIKICISCTNRTERDCLASCIRALVCQRAGASIETRIKSLPWQSTESDQKAKIAGASESGSEMLKRLKHLEQENLRLEKLISKVRETGIESNIIPDDTSTDVDTNTNTDNDHNEIKITENANTSSVKILELENKLSILQRKEIENIKIREVLEAKYDNAMTTLADLTQDNSKYQDDLSKLKTEHNNNLNAYETLKIEKEKVEKINTQFFNTDSVRAAEKEELLNSVAEKEKLLNSQIEEISMLKVRLETLEKLEKELETLKTKSIEQEKLLDNNRVELEYLKSESEEIKQQHDNMKSLYENQKNRLEKLEEMEKEFVNVQAKADRLAGEINHQSKRAESQAKDLKKIIKENGLTISEYEKALTRKSNECQELETRINQLLDMEQGLNERESISSRLNKGLSEISIPRIKIPSPAKYIGSSTSPPPSSSSSSGTSSITEGSKKISEKMKSFLSTKVQLPFSHSDSNNNNNNAVDNSKDEVEEMSKS